jgi:hypothetical protein
MIRVLVSGLVVAFAWTFAAMPLAASARGGGFAVSRTAAVHGNFHGLAPRPMASPLLARHPAAPHVPLIAPVAGLHKTPLPRFRRFLGRGLPARGIGVYYGAYGAYGGDGSLYADPAGPSLTSGDEFARPRSRCGTEVRIVPAEAGGERRITITYC